MTRLKLPTSLYFVISDFRDANGKEPELGMVDPVTNLDDAATQLGEIERIAGCNGRVFEVTLDVATNRFESAREVTDECIDRINAWMEAAE